MQTRECFRAWNNCCPGRLLTVTLWLPWVTHCTIAAGRFAHLLDSSTVLCLRPRRPITAPGFFSQCDILGDYQRRPWNTCRGAGVIVLASPKLASVMHVHHWLGWLAVNLAMLWLGVEMSQPPPEPVAKTYAINQTPAKNTITGRNSRRHSNFPAS